MTRRNKKPTTSVEGVLEEVERQTKTKSVQQRFNTDYELVNQVIAMISRTNQEIPPYSSDTRQRDTALLSFARSENLLSGVLSSAVSRDKNRGWTLTGNARQVSEFGKRLHAVHNGVGWRQFVSFNSTSWYATNIGYISEIGFQQKNGRAETMWHLDPTVCKLTANPKEPVYYYPTFGKVPLLRGEFIQGNSMPSVEEKMKYAGFCGVERSIQFARLMIGIFNHQLEKLGVAPPKGILHGTGIERREFASAVEQFDEDRKNKNQTTYSGVLGLFTKNPDAKLNLIGLSELPDNFTLKAFVEVLMQGYALAFGYPVGEFWAIESGSFGRTGEMNIQQEQANAKGELDFALSFQEQLQTHFLPSSLSFEFDSRNDKGDQLKSEVDAKRIEMITKMYESGLKDGASLIERDEARLLLSEFGLIPKEWVKDSEQDVTASDLQEMREKVLSNPSTIHVIKSRPNEPVVQYRWNYKENSILGVKRFGENTQCISDYLWMPGEVRVLWENGEEALRKRVF